MSPGLSLTPCPQLDASKHQRSPNTGGDPQTCPGDPSARRPGLPTGTQPPLPDSGPEPGGWGLGVGVGHPTLPPVTAEKGRGHWRMKEKRAGGPGVREDVWGPGRQSDICFPHPEERGSAEGSRAQRKKIPGKPGILE